MGMLYRKIELYITSLWLLFFLLFVGTVDIPFYFGDDWHFIGLKSLLLMNVVPVVSVIFMALGCFFYLRFDYNVIRSAPQLPKRITSIKNLNYETLSFLITYIIPLVCFGLDFDLNNARNLIMLLLILFVIGWIYVRANIYYTNPTLAVLGFRIYQVDTESSTNLIVIIKSALSVGDHIHPTRIDENIYFAKKRG